MTKYEVEEKTVEYLKTVFDPEIPVNVWDLGMIYKIDVKETAEPADGKDFDIDIDMTESLQQFINVKFTTPGLEGVYGDVNGDGEVTAADVTCVYNVILGQ